MTEKRFPFELILLFVAIHLTVAVDHEDDLSFANMESNNIPESMYDFLATRGRRDNDLFWANRGKRSSGRLKPNGFIFVMGKRLEGADSKKNSIKPNGFNFLLAGKRGARLRPNSFNIPLKRDGHNFNSPEPNGFLFPQSMGKKSDSQINFNSPRPIGLMFPVSGKREDTKVAWKNMVKPNGFLFSMSKGKRSDEEVPEFGDLESSSQEFEKQFEDTFEDESFVDSEDGGLMDKRSGLNGFDSFFAGRGKKNWNDQDIFVAGRG